MILVSSNLNDSMVYFIFLYHVCLSFQCASPFGEMIKGRVQASAEHSFCFFSWRCLCKSFCCPQPQQSPAGSLQLKVGRCCCSTEAWSGFPGVDVVWHSALARDGFQWEVWVWPSCFRSKNVGENGGPTPVGLGAREWAHSIYQGSYILRSTCKVQ